MTIDDDDDDEIEIELRPAADVTARLILVAALCRRAYIERFPSDFPDNDAAAERFDHARWLDGEGFLDAATAEERRLLDAPAGSWTATEAAARSWQGEGLLALGWALGLIDHLPPFDTAADVGPLLSQLPEPWSSTVAFRRDASLRDEGDIAFAREHAEIWHWRGEAAALLAAAPLFERPAITAAIAAVAAEARSAGLLDRVADAVLAADFAVRGRPYASLAPDAAEELGLVAFERLRALDWLCGLSPSWESIPPAD